MLESMRRGQRWLTGVFIAVIGLVFVFFLGLGEPLTGGSAGPAGTVVKAGNVKYNASDYYRTRSAQSEQLQERLGDQFDPDAAESFLNDQALRTLVDDAIHAHAASEMGLQVTRTEIQNFLRDLPQFRNEDGVFDTASFADWVEYNYGSQRAFLELMRSDLLRSKVIRLLYSHPRVSDAEARRSAQQRLETVTLGHVTLDTERLPASQALSEDEVGAYLESHTEAVRANYEQNSDRYQQPEARRTRHILFRTPVGPTDEELAEAKGAAEAAQTRINEGAAFEDVAREESDDKATAERGGEIGFIVRGQSLPALEEAIFELEPGGGLGITRTDSGFHVLRVDEIRAAGEIPYEDASTEIARELAEKEAAATWAQKTAEELSAAVANGESLEQAAGLAGADYRLTEELSRRADGYLPGIGASPELMAEAFSLTEQKPRSGRVASIDSKLTLIELKGQGRPSDRELADEALIEKERLLAEKRTLLLQAWLDGHRQRLNEAEALHIDASIVTGGS